MTAIDLYISELFTHDDEMGIDTQWFHSLLFGDSASAVSKSVNFNDSFICATVCGTAATTIAGDELGATTASIMIVSATTASIVGATTASVVAC